MANFKGDSSVLFDNAHNVIVPLKDVEANELLNLDPDLYLQRIQNVQSPHERVSSLLKSTFFLENGTYESRYIHTASSAGILGGLFYGAFIKTRDAQERFIRNHNAAVFESRFEGIRKHKDAVITECVGKGIRYAVRTGALCASTSLLVFIPVTYRNEARLIDLTLACGTIGALSRTWLGSRAMLVGGGLGAVAGILATGLFKFMQSALGLSIAEMRYEEHMIWLKKREAAVKKVQAMREKKLESYMNSVD